MTSRPFNRALAVLALLAVGCSDDPSGPSSDADEDGSGEVAPEVIAWLQVNGKAFTTPEAGNGFADLQFLKGMVGDARVVALGEATHGTREFFQMKHRILEFLVQEMGFDMQFPGMAIHNVIEYRSGVDPPAAAAATELYSCMLRYANGPDGAPPRQATYRDQPQSYRDECQQDLKEVRDSLLAHQDAYEAASSAAEFAMIVLWAHNGHVAENPSYSGGSSMGWHLRAHYSDDLVIVGFDFYQGGFRAVHQISTGGYAGVTNHTVGPAPVDSYEHFFHSASMERMVLDTRN